MRSRKAQNLRPLWRCKICWHTHFNIHYANYARHGCTYYRLSLRSRLWSKKFLVHQRFVSSTGNMEVLLSHTHSIVCVSLFLIYNYFFYPKMYFFKITVVSLHFHCLSAVCICSSIECMSERRTFMFPVLDTNLWNSYCSLHEKWPFGTHGKGSNKPSNIGILISWAIIIIPT